MSAFTLRADIITNAVKADKNLFMIDVVCDFMVIIFQFQCIFACNQRRERMPLPEDHIRRYGVFKRCPDYTCSNCKMIFGQNISG